MNYAEIWSLIQIINKGDNVEHIGFCNWLWDVFSLCHAILRTAGLS